MFRWGCCTRFNYSGCLLLYTGFQFEFWFLPELRVLKFMNNILPFKWYCHIEDRIILKPILIHHSLVCLSIHNIKIRLPDYRLFEFLGQQWELLLSVSNLIKWGLMNLQYFSIKCLHGTLKLILTFFYIILYLLQFRNLIAYNFLVFGLFFILKHCLFANNNIRLLKFIRYSFPFHLMCYVEFCRYNQVE